jgi:ABC-type lipoprotein release transport system permease subunit
MVQLILLVRLAVRNVWRSPRRSLLTMAAIAFGLFCLLIFQGLKAGLHREMVASVVQLDAASLQVVAAGRGESLTRLQPLRDPRQVITLLNGRREATASLRLRAPGLVTSPAGSAAVILTGVDPAAEARVTVIAGRLAAGRYLEPRGGVLLGAALAESLGVKVGDEVTVLVQTLFGKPGSRRLPVGGIYRTELASFDRSHLFLDLPTAQQLFDADGVATAVAVHVAPESEAEVTAWLRDRLPADRYRVASWQELAPDVTQLIDLNDGTMRLLVVIVFAIVALGIVNTMGMSVMERITEFGVLAALGIRPAQVIALVVCETLALGAVAAAAGSLAGMAACGYLGAHGLDLTSLTSANQYFATSHVLKAHLELADVLAANLVGLATALLAGLVPAWRASRLAPAVALRRA